jgi:hypothetical protein
MLQKELAFDVTERTMANRDQLSIGNHPSTHIYLFIYLFIY